MQIKAWWHKFFFSSLVLFFFFLRLYSFLERGKEKENERERTINVQLPPVYPAPGTWPTTQACALTRNQTSDPLVCSLCSIRHWAIPAKAVTYNFTQGHNQVSHWGRIWIDVDLGPISIFFLLYNPLKGIRILMCGFETGLFLAP